MSSGLRIRILLPFLKMTLDILFLLEKNAFYTKHFFLA